MWPLITACDGEWDCLVDEISSPLLSGGKACLSGFYGERFCSESYFVPSPSIIVLCFF